MDQTDAFDRQHTKTFEELKEANLLDARQMCNAKKHPLKARHEQEGARACTTGVNIFGRAGRVVGNVTWTTGSAHTLGIQLPSRGTS